MKSKIFILFSILVVIATVCGASYLGNLKEIGTSGIGRAVTNTLYVHTEGSGTSGKTWNSAFTTIQAALGAASTDASDCTLIYIAQHATNYDIDTTSDPTYTGNYILKGSHRTWAKIKNTHTGATSILKFTGKVSLIDLNFNLGSGSGNGIIVTHDGWRIRNCIFIGEDLTGAGTAIHLDGAARIKHGILENCHFDGHVTHMTAILLDKTAHSHFRHAHIYDCLVGIQIVDATSDSNIFKEIDIDKCVVGLDVDAGNDQHFFECGFHGNTINIDDEVGDHVYEHIHGEFPMCLCPDDLIGVQLDASNDANVYGPDTEVRSAVLATIPFRVTEVIVELGVAQKYEIRLSADSGVTFFDYIIMDTAIGIQSNLPSSFLLGTEYIFNKGTRISGSVKAESGGEDTCQIWLKVQQI